MPAPSPSWQLIDLKGTWNNWDGTLKQGTYTISVPVEITNKTDGVKIPAGVYATGNLNVTPGSPSLAIQVPCTNDPDNDPQPDWQLTVAITFTTTGSAGLTKAAPETYLIYAPYADRPTADGGTGDGVDLINFAPPTSIPQTNPSYKIGVAGGLAELDQAGLVINADGSHPGGGIDSVVGGTNVTIDDTDPQNPVINVSGAGTGIVQSVVQGTNITVDDTDPANPIISGPTLDSLGGAPATRTVAGLPLSGDIAAADLLTGLAIPGASISTAGLVQFATPDDTTSTDKAATAASLAGVASTRLAVDSGGALARFRGFLTAEPASPVAGDFFFLIGS